MISDLRDRAGGLLARLAGGCSSEDVILGTLDDLVALEDELVHTRDKVRALVRAAGFRGWDEPDELRMLYQTEEAMDNLFWELRESAAGPLLYWAGVWLARGESGMALRGLEMAWSCRPGEPVSYPGASRDCSEAAQGR